MKMKKAGAVALSLIMLNGALNIWQALYFRKEGGAWISHFILSLLVKKFTLSLLWQVIV